MKVSNTIIDRLSTRLGRENTDIIALSEGLGATLCDLITEDRQVALPSFGTFDTIKEDEHITTDLSTGERLLVPPCITPVFTPSALLRRRINSSDPQ